MSHRIDREAARYLGYGGAVISEEIQALIEKIRLNAEETIKPKSVYGTFDLPSMQFDGTSIAQHLDGASGCLLFAATLGAESERLALYYQKTDLQNAVVFDAVCSAMIESYCDTVCAQIAAEMREKGKYVNTRFSPGYGDFSIAYQKSILDRLNAARRIGLTVNESCLLLPQKSVTAVIGVFDAPPQGHARGCEACAMQAHCKMRKTKGTSACLNQTNSTS